MSARTGEAPIIEDKTIFIATKETIPVAILMMLTFKDHGQGWPYLLKSNHTNNRVCTTAQKRSLKRLETGLDSELVNHPVLERSFSKKNIRKFALAPFCFLGRKSPN